MKMGTAAKRRDRDDDGGMGIGCSHTRCSRTSRGHPLARVGDTYRRRRYPTTAAALQERRESEEGGVFVPRPLWLSLGFAISVAIFAKVGVESR